MCRCLFAPSLGYTYTLSSQDFPGFCFSKTTQWWQQHFITIAVDSVRKWHEHIIWLLFKWRIIQFTKIFFFFFFVLRTMTHSKTGCRIWYCFKWGIKHPCLGRVQSLYLLFLHWLILSCNKFQLKPFNKAHCEQFKLQKLPTDECKCQN